MTRKELLKQNVEQCLSNPEKWHDSLNMTNSNHTIAYEAASVSIQKMLTYSLTGNKPKDLIARMWWNDSLPLVKPQNPMQMFCYGLQCVQTELKKQFLTNLRVAARNNTNSYNEIPAYKRMIVDRCLKSVDETLYKEHAASFNENQTVANRELKYVSLLFSESIRVYASVISSVDRFWHAHGQASQYLESPTEDKIIAYKSRMSASVKPLMAKLYEQLLQEQQLLDEWFGKNRPRNHVIEILESKSIGSNYTLRECQVEYDRLTFAILVNNELEKVISNT